MTVKEEAVNSYYNLKPFRSIKWLIIFISLFFYSVLSVIPFQDKIDSFIFSSLKSIPGCSIQMSDYQMGFFPPRIALNDLSIPGRCLKVRQSSIDLKNVALYFRGFNFSPLAPHFKLETKLKQKPLSLFLTYSGSSLAMNMQDNIIDLSILEMFYPQVKLKGNLSTNLYSVLNRATLNDTAVNISSKDFYLPAQNIMGFNLPTLRLNNILIQAKSDKNNNLVVEKLIAGDESSPIRMNFKGEVKVNSRNIGFSNIDLKGELQLSEELLQKFSIIKIFLNSFDQKDGFYQIHLKGTINSPKAVSVK